MVRCGRERAGRQATAQPVGDPGDDPEWVRQEVRRLGLHGLAIALLPRFAADNQDGQRLVLVPTRDLALGRRMAVLSRRDHAERAAAALVREALVAEADSLTSPA